MRFTHVRLLVPNVRECFLFYRDILGFNVAWGEEGIPYAEFETGNTKIALNERKIVSEAVGTLDKPYELDAQDNVAIIFEVDSVDDTYQHLMGKGVSFVTEPHDETGWGVRVAHFRDPAGNLIEINRGI